MTVNERVVYCPELLPSHTTNHIHIEQLCLRDHSEDIPLVVTVVRVIFAHPNINIIMFECVSPKEVLSKSVLSRASSLSSDHRAHLSGSVTQTETQPSMSCLTLFAASGGPAVSDNEHRSEANNSATLLSHSANYYLNSARASDFTIFPKLTEQSRLGHAKPLAFDSCSLSSLYPVLSNNNSSLQLAVS